MEITQDVECTSPYVVKATIEGVTPLLFYTRCFVTDDGHEMEWRDWDDDWRMEKKRINIERRNRAMATAQQTKDLSEVYGPEPTNAAAEDVERELPFVVEFAIEGVTPILFHRWNNEAVEEKSNAKKGSAAKKTDNVESYIYRNEKGEICLPGVYVHGSMQYAAKYRQDPRSPRKSAFDLFKAAVSPLTELASLGSAKWDYLDARRVTVQRNGVTRHRPAFNSGWRAEMQFVVNLPEYVSPMFFQDVLTLAGRAVGVADFRPTYGRYQIVKFEVLDL